MIGSSRGAPSSFCPSPTTPDPASKITVLPVRSSVTSMHGVLQPWPMADGIAHGTDPRTPQNLTCMFASSVVDTRAASRGDDQEPGSLRAYPNRGSDLPSIATPWLSRTGPRLPACFQAFPALARPPRLAAVRRRGTACAQNFTLPTGLIAGGGWRADNSAILRVGITVAAPQTPWLRFRERASHYADC